MARRADPEDWIFALVSLQTGEGFGGATNYGIARMNGGSSSRAMMALAPAPGGKGVTPRLGACFRRDVLTLLESRERELAANDHLGFPAEGGLALVWLAPWREGEQIHLSELDIWFVEVCRRVRLREKGGTIFRGERNLKGGAHRRQGAQWRSWRPLCACTQDRRQEPHARRRRLRLSATNRLAAVRRLAPARVGASGDLRSRNAHARLFGTCRAATAKRTASRRAACR